MLIERRSPGAYAFFRVGSEIERHLDIAKYYSLFTCARMTKNTELTIRRKRQMLLPLIVKNRQEYWYNPDKKLLSNEIEPHTMPYYVLKRLLGRIPRKEIEGKTVLDLFSGHGSVAFALATGGLDGDVKPKQLIMLDNVYTGSRKSYSIFPSSEAQYWKSDYVTLSHNLHTSFSDGPGGWIFNKAPNYCAGDGSMLPIKNGSIDTVAADPPFGMLTKTADPEGLLMRSLHEVKRILRPRGNAYYLIPRVWTNDVMGNSPMPGTLLERNIGRTWFDISLVKFTNGE